MDEPPKESESESPTGPRLYRPPGDDSPAARCAGLAAEQRRHVSAALASLDAARLAECELLAVARAALASGRLKLKTAYATDLGVLVLTGTRDEPKVTLAAYGPGFTRAG